MNRTGKHGFTLIEMMVASTISAIIMVSLCSALLGVWYEARVTNEELQVMIQSSAMRERLLVGTAPKNKAGFHGILNISNEVAVLNGKVLQVDPGGPGEAYESVRSDAAARVTLGKSKKNDSSCVTVTDVSVPEKDEANYADVEKRQRVCVWLWNVTKAGTVCRMPVNLTVISFKEKGGGS